MKLIKRIGYLLLLLSVLLMLLLFACAWKPELAGQIADRLYADRVEQQETEEEQEGEAVSPNEEEGLKTDTENESEDGGEENAERAQSTDAAYIAPDREKILVPEEVRGKNGYQEITGNDSEVGEEEAGKLQDVLSVGETGDGLLFDPLYYPYYEMLDEKGQHLYRQIYANAKVLNAEFAPIEPVKARQLRDIFSAVYNDHPELFWVDTAYSCKHMRNGDCVEIGLSFHRTADNLEKENAVFEGAAEEILSAARGLSNDYDKERYVHDMLVRKVDYVKSAEMNQSAYSALVNGRSVCAGYARAFQYLLQQLQIPCYYCTGYAGESHAWNIVSLEDGFYNVDVTWDDNDEGLDDYFNKSDADYADTHVREELSVYLPPCTGELYRSEETPEEDGESGRRTSADAGFDEDDIMHSMEEYYEKCGERIVQNGTGEYSFDIVIEGGDLYKEWEKAYDKDGYKEGYMIEAMRRIGAKSCHIRLTTEKLQQERYLITHELQLH